ncbi:ABC transporter permease [candidate division WOR-3 bacterium]|nr:ABC transporter permease [candidate division WOR-3 bacterium]
MIYIFQEAFKGFFKNKSMSLITIGIISVSIFIFGLFIIGTANLMNLIKLAEDKIEMVAYINENTNENGIQSVRNNILSIAGVQSVEYISKEQAKEQFIKDFKDNASLLEVFENNPLPASIKVHISIAYKNPENLNNISEKIALFKEISDVDYGAEWVDELDRAVKFLFIIDIILGIIIALASVFIVFNTIRLTIMARKDQIDIMDLVGATESYIEIPYIIEGVFHGLLGSLISAGILYLLFSFLSTKFPALISMNNSIIYILAIFGVFLGFIGSIMSVKQCLSEIRDFKSRKKVKI